MLDEVDQLEDPSAICDIQYRWRELVTDPSLLRSPYGFARGG
jgi:hypothetical protein